MKHKKALQDLIIYSLLEESKAWRFRTFRKPALVYKDKELDIESAKHLAMLKQTLEHLIALRAIYPSGSANRHVISQACSRLKRLINKLEKIS